MCRAVWRVHSSLSSRESLQGRLLGQSNLIATSLLVVTSSQRGEARRGEAQMVEATGGGLRLRCAPLPTSPRWREESETVGCAALTVNNLPL